MHISGPFLHAVEGDKVRVLGIKLSGRKLKSRISIFFSGSSGGREAAGVTPPNKNTGWGMPGTPRNDGQG